MSMSDVNLFSSKTDVKKLLSKNEKVLCSTDSWQDLSAITSTITFDNASWQSAQDYLTVPKSFGVYGETVGYCRLDQQGHWLLRSPPPLLQRHASNVVTYYDRKRLSRDSNTQRTFPDSFKSSSISMDFNDRHEYTSIVPRNRLRHYENMSFDDSCIVSR